MKKITLVGSFTALALFSASAVNATPYIVNVPLSNIQNKFDDVISATGSPLTTIQVVNGKNVYDFTDNNGNAASVTVTRPNGSTPSTTSSYGSNGISLSGASWVISPARNANDPIPGFNSGVTFTFSSPVNAFGFEVGDWATCCRTGTRPAGVVDGYGVPASGSGLWIAFDGGAATLPANALTAADNPGFAQDKSYTNFIGAIDSSGYFQSITFFGDGFGEYLLAGGTLRFALVPLGSVDKGGVVPVPIPEPETWAMLLAGLGIVGAVAKRNRKG
ncbi:MAG: PEP-CTERM sorting domain-containing protein [Betaproteobacteria bacterium]|nr:PEP-CTERM sorting domain-containing protein [Betaproteobacteria bacterium]